MRKYFTDADIRNLQAEGRRRQLRRGALPGKWTEQWRHRWGVSADTPLPEVLRTVTEAGLPCLEISGPIEFKSYEQLLDLEKAQARDALDDFVNCGAIEDPVAPTRKKMADLRARRVPKAQEWQSRALKLRAEHPKVKHRWTNTAVAKQVVKEWKARKRKLRVNTVEKFLGKQTRQSRAK